jgi:hypothetical protein
LPASSAENVERFRNLVVKIEAAEPAIGEMQFDSAQGLLSKRMQQGTMSIRPVSVEHRKSHIGSMNYADVIGPRPAVYAEGLFF